MHRNADPQIRRYLRKSGGKSDRFQDNYVNGRWLQFPGADESPCHEPEKKERSWLVTAIPVWILVIIVFLFLVSERHLAAYDAESCQVLDVTYCIWNNQLRDMTFYNESGQKAILLNRRNDWGKERSAWTLSDDGSGNYITVYFVNSCLFSRTEHRNYMLSKAIYYRPDGLIDRLEESVNGVMHTYVFRQESDEGSASYVR